MTRALPLALALVPVLACGGGHPSADAAPTVDAAPIGGSDAGACLSAEAQVANEGWVHVGEGAGVSYGHNPPTSGSHYPRWARYQIHDEAVARGYWVHDLEHGGIVLVHRPDAPAAVLADLLAAYAAIPPDPECGHKRALVVADPELTTPIAIVAADWFRAGDCVDRAAVVAFTAAHRGHGPEDVCADGSFP